MIDLLRRILTTKLQTLGCALDSGAKRIDLRVDTVRATGCESGACQGPPLVCERWNLLYCHMQRTRVQIKTEGPTWGRRPWVLWCDQRRECWNQLRWQVQWAHSNCLKGTVRLLYPNIIHKRILTESLESPPINHYLDDESKNTLHGPALQLPTWTAKKPNISV